MAESKVKAYTRRSKDGKQVRVKEGRRKLLKRAAQVAVGSAAAYGIYKGGKKLNAKIAERGFKPSSDGFIGKQNQSVLANSQNVLGKAQTRSRTRQVMREGLEELRQSTRAKSVDAKVTTQKPFKEAVKERYDQMEDPKYNPFIDKAPPVETSKAPKFGETRKIEGARGEGEEITVLAKNSSGKVSKEQKSGMLKDLIYDRRYNTKGKVTDRFGDWSQGNKNQRALGKVNEEIADMLEDGNMAKVKKLRAAKKRIGQRIKKEGRLRNFSRFKAVPQ